MRWWTETRLLAFAMVLVASSAAEGGGVLMCPRESILDSMVPVRDRYCVVSDDSLYFDGVIEGDEVSLQKALHMVQRNSHEYVAVLFHASWCPFSHSFGPSFPLLSSMYPSILHLAIEESSVRPSILSKYGVSGFPTLFLLNSTMRVRYHGSRNLGSLLAFYSDVTGIKKVSLNKVSRERSEHAPNHEKHDTMEPESCPFSWARSPEHLFRQETYLALATAFVILRLLYFVSPTLLVFSQLAWRRYIRNARIGTLLERCQACLNKLMQLLKFLKEPCRKSNLQEGSLNYRAWASKSLATVSIGDASSSRGVPATECR